LLDCPIHTASRRKHLTVSGRPRNLSQPFDNLTISSSVRTILFNFVFINIDGSSINPFSSYVHALHRMISSTAHAAVLGPSNSPSSFDSLAVLADRYYVLMRDRLYAFNLGGLVRESHDRAWSLAEQGAEHVAIDFLFWPRRCSSLSPSLARFFLPSHRSLRTLASLPELTAPHRPAARHSAYHQPAQPQARQHRNGPPLQPQHQRHAAYISTLPGTVWTRREPAARSSSPTHPRSWQALFQCSDRARKYQALYPHYRLYVCFIYIS
jgi:hypothetical protein